MNIGSDFIRSSLEALPQKSQTEAVRIYPGIELFYFSFAEDSISIRHEPMDHILQINYCRAGQAVWTMENGEHICLNPGSFSLHTMNACAMSHITFPAKTYQGLMFWIDLSEASAHPPELVKDANIFGAPFQEKFCQGDVPAVLAGNERTEGIFSGFPASGSRRWSCSCTFPGWTLPRKANERNIRPNRSQLSGRSMTSFFSIWSGASRLKSSPDNI